MTTNLSHQQFAVRYIIQQKESNTPPAGEQVYIDELGNRYIDENNTLYVDET
jgi:hypothetical protein